MAKLQTAALTPAQLEIMNLIWDHGELTVAQVWKMLAGRRTVARNTVQTMLTRLADKGWLVVRAEGKTFYFRGSQHRQSAVRKMIKQFVDNVFDGSASRLVMTLLDDRRISPDEIRQIHKLIADAERKRQ
jgi:BlaI family transcriptional regulator, penicillinase repressor